MSPAYLSYPGRADVSYRGVSRSHIRERHAKNEAPEEEPGIQVLPGLLHYHHIRASMLVDLCMLKLCLIKYIL